LRDLKPVKRLEYIPQLSSWNANAGVVYLDANNRPKTTTSKKNQSAGSGEFDGVPRETANDASQNDRIAYDPPSPTAMRESQCCVLGPGRATRPGWR
jgi:hypothetical protein